MRSRPFLALLAVLALAACGQKDDSAEKAAAMLRAYYADRPLDYGWEVSRVERVSNEEIRVDVMVDDDGVIGQIRARSRMDQMGIARIACPDFEHPFVKSIDREIKVAVALNSPQAILVKSSCKR